MVSNMVRDSSKRLVRLEKQNEIIIIGVEALKICRWFSKLFPRSP